MKVVFVICLALAAVQAIELVPIPMKHVAEKPSGKITGGVEVPPHALPYQVGLFIEMADGSGTAFCGGSLISPEWVLTAAHCADPGKTFEVVLGAHFIKDQTEATQVRVTSTVKAVHPEWSMLTLRNDVALIKLPSPVTLNENIQTIRLPSQGELTETFVDTDAIMSGWGKQTDESTAIADTLQAINKTVISNARCAPYYLGVLVQTAHICTSGKNGQSTCNGDSGGPLVFVEADGQKTQIGIVSFGIAFGCEIGWPPVFTRLTTYVPWISETTGIAIRP